MCGNDARPSPSHQCRTRIGSSTTTPAGTCTNAPPARNASCSTVNASSERARRGAEQIAHVVAVARRDAADPHTLGLEPGIDLVVHHAPVAHDDHRRVRPGLGRPRTATGRPLVARPAELGFCERPVTVEVELTDAAVAPDLLVGGRPRERGERARRPRRGAPRASRARPAPARRRRRMRQSSFAAVGLNPPRLPC